MPNCSKKTIDLWNFSCVAYELDSDGNVSLLWCKICREFYDEQNNRGCTSGAKGVAHTGKLSYQF